MTVYVWSVSGLHSTPSVCLSVLSCTQLHPLHYSCVAGEAGSWSPSDLASPVLAEQQGWQVLAPCILKTFGDFKEEVDFSRFEFLKVGLGHSAA